MPADTSAIIPLVDSHCHLAWPDFAGAELDLVVARMREAGVLQAIVVATDAASAEKCRAICERRDGLHPTAGLHPNDVPAGDAAALEAFLAVERLVKTRAFVAVGETGLDYYRDAVPPAVQQPSFRSHAQLAREMDLPLIVHIRDREGRWQAYDDVATILEETPGVRGVIHCYTGDAAHARRYLDVGFFVSFSGIITFPKGENVREAARSIPLDRLLVETDAPFLAPLPWRGKRNEPGYVAETARKLAEVIGVGEAEVRRATAANARKLFGLPEPASTA